MKRKIENVLKNETAITVGYVAGIVAAACVSIYAFAHVVFLFKR